MTNRWARARTRVRDYVNQINLQWHHVIPETKYKAIAEIVSEDRSMKKVDAEIEKCICVCKACHGKLEM